MTTTDTAGSEPNVSATGVETWGVTLFVDGRYQEGTAGRDVYESQEVH